MGKLESYSYRFEVVTDENGRKIVLHGFKLATGEKVFFPHVEPKDLGASWDEELGGWYI